MRLEVEYSAREIDHDEYTREHWRDEDLKPMANGHVFFPKVAGAGYVHHHPM
jgi:hypothetical protein